MTLVLNLPPDAEQSLHKKAAQNGITPQDYVVRLLLSDLPPLDNVQTNRLPRDESQLLAQINQGIATDVWTRYDVLLQKRDAHTLTPEEQNELLALSDRIEEENALRMGRAAELAQLRGTTFSDLVQALGIGPRKKSANG